MSLKLINTTASSILPKDTRLRVTFSKAYDILDNAFFVKRIHEINNAIAGLGRGYTTSPDPAILDGKPAVMDIRLTQPVSVAQYANELETVAGFYVDLTQLEKLTPEQAKVSTGDKGAVEREQVKEEKAKQEEDDSFSGHIARFFGIAKTVVIVGVVAAIIVLLIVYAPEIKTVSKRLTK